MAAKDDAEEYMNQELLLARARECSLKGWATMWAVVHNAKPTDDMIEGAQSMYNHMLGQPEEGGNEAMKAAIHGAC